MFSLTFLTRIAASAAVFIALALQPALATSQTQVVSASVADRIGFSLASEGGSTVEVTVHRVELNGRQVITVIPRG